MHRILLAEDNPADVHLLREALQGECGHLELIVVSDGEEAMAFVDRVGQWASTPDPDLIVLDLNLPKSDGGDILKRIRAKPEYENTPVVILTSSDSPRDRAATEKLGADLYLTKPSDLDAFLGLGSILADYLPGTGTKRRAPARGTVR